jgi:hypothetical protein
MVRARPPSCVDLCFFEIGIHEKYKAGKHDNVQSTSIKFKVQSSKKMHSKTSIQCIYIFFLTFKLYDVFSEAEVSRFDNFVSISLGVNINALSRINDPTAAQITRSETERPVKSRSRNGTKYRSERPEKCTLSFSLSRSLSLSLPFSLSLSPVLSLSLPFSLSLSISLSLYLPLSLSLFRSLSLSPSLSLSHFRGRA